VEYSDGSIIYRGYELKPGKIHNEIKQWLLLGVKVQGGSAITGFCFKNLDQAKSGIDTLIERGVRYHGI